MCAVSITWTTSARPTRPAALDPCRVDVVHLGRGQEQGRQIRRREDRGTGHLAPRGDHRGRRPEVPPPPVLALDEVLLQLRVDQRIRDARPTLRAHRPAPRPCRGRTRPRRRRSRSAARRSGRGRVRGRGAPASRRGPAPPWPGGARSRRRTSGRSVERARGRGRPSRPRRPPRAARSPRRGLRGAAVAAEIHGDQPQLGQLLGQHPPAARRAR